MRKSLHPPHIVPAPSSTIKHGGVPFSPCHSLERLIFHELLIILTLGRFVIEVSHVVAVVRTILTKNHIKFDGYGAYDHAYGLKYE